MVGNTWFHNRQGSKAVGRLLLRARAILANIHDMMFISNVTALYRAPSKPAIRPMISPHDTKR
jgi:hypothetical protein